MWGRGEGDIYGKVEMQEENGNRFFGGMTAWAETAALGFVWIGMALAWGAAAVQWGRTVGEWTGWEAAGVALALAWAAGVAAGLSWVGRRWGERAFAGAAVGVSLAVGLGWAWAARGMGRWPMDSGFFRAFLERLAEGGFSAETLRGLTGQYDYGAWATRALPFLLPLRVWAGPERFGWSVQASQAVLGAAGVALAWRTAALLFGARAARWTAIGLVAMPGHGLQAVGLNHQVWGTFSFVGGMWLLAEWMFGGGGWKKKAALFAGAVALSPLWTLWGSVGQVWKLSAWLLAALEWLRGGRRRAALGAMAFLLAVPAFTGRWMTGPWFATMREANPESMNGGRLAFLARGWDFATMGEYSDDMQTMDVLTPRGEKDRFFGRFIAGQCAWNGKSLAGKLFPAKLAKFLLAGYASLAEEVFGANGAERTARVARGMRTGYFVLLYGPLMLWGLRRLAGRKEDGRAAWVLVPVAMFGAAVMFVGETSPRYSIPVQSLLVAAGACGLACGGRGGTAGSRRFAGGVALAAGAYAVAAALLLGLRGTWEKWAPEDMRKVGLEGGQPAEEPWRAPFEAEFPGGAGLVTWAGNGGGMAVYLGGASWRERGRAEVAWGDGEWRETQFPARLEGEWPEGGDRRLAVRRAGGTGALRVGYASKIP